MRKLVGAAALAAAATLLIGCNGDGGSPIAKSEFITRGNAICEAGTVAIDAAGTAAGLDDPATITRQKLIAFVADVVVPNVRQQLANLRALGYPEDDRAALDAIYKDAGAALDKLADDPSALITGGADPFASVNDRFKSYGLSECARG